MIYPDKPFYVVSGLAPRTDMITDAFNFSIGLDPTFATRFYQEEIREETPSLFNKRAKSILESLNLDERHLHPCTFVKNNEDNFTALLRWCKVPGNACELGIYGSTVDSIHREGEVNNILIYGPHNIDSMKQAYGLLSIWTCWADWAFSITRKN